MANAEKKLLYNNKFVLSLHNLAQYKKYFYIFSFYSIHIIVVISKNLVCCYCNETSLQYFSMKHKEVEIIVGKCEKNFSYF